MQHPLKRAGILSESLQAELDLAFATTKAEEELISRQTEVKCASTSAEYKQMQMYRRQRKELLQKLIQEKKEYIQILKQKIAEVDELPDSSSSFSYSYDSNCS